MTNSTPRWAALRHHDFLLLWLGVLISATGSQMQLTVVNWQVYELLADSTSVITVLGQTFSLSADALGLGTLGLARVAPIFVFALLGGVLADASDRRRIMAISSVLSMLSALVLALLTFIGQASLLWIYLLTALNSGATALGNPARQALVPNLVPKQDFTNAVSLNTLIMQIAQLAGPALGGVLLTLLPIGIIYGINTATFAVLIVALVLMRFRDSNRASKGSVSLGAVAEGFRFVFGVRLLRSTMMLDFWATFFSSARTMLPIIADKILQTDEVGYGALSTAAALGSVLTGFLMTLRREIYRQGLWLLGSVVVYGIATAVFGVAMDFVLAFVMLALTGAADTVSTVLRNIIRQNNTPDVMRGRMIGVNQLFFQGGPQLGELEAGLIGAAFGVPFAIVSGGVATIAIALWMAWCYPDLQRYTAVTDRLAA
jgi:MFS family permease